MSEVQGVYQGLWKNNIPRSARTKRKIIPTPSDLQENYPFVTVCLILKPYLQFPQLQRVRSTQDEEPPACTENT